MVIAGNMVNIILGSAVEKNRSKPSGKLIDCLLCFTPYRHYSSQAMAVYTQT